LFSYFFFVSFVFFSFPKAKGSTAPIGGYSLLDLKSNLIRN